VQTPADEAITDRTARRRHVLQRLHQEAAAQEALPTDDDLAQALNVSRRTILRDIQALAEEGIRIATRARR
jgi:biotin operon repressor